MRNLHHTRLVRLFHAVCVVFVLAYIAFDVLDLDGSKLSALTSPAGAAVVAVEETAEAGPVSRLAPADWWNGSGFIGDRSDRWALHHFPVLSLSPLDSARMHGYRVGLPRDAITDH
jgi:hypothetical protein